MKVRRAFGPQRVLLLVAYGVRANGQRELLAFTRAKGESQAAWEGFLYDLQQRGLPGRHLQLVLTDGCAGLARGARNRLSPRATPTLLGAQDAQPARRVRRRDQEQVKRDAQRIYLARNVGGARRAFERFRFHWRRSLPGTGEAAGARSAGAADVLRFPAALWRKLRTTNAIERCFVEVRRRTRPMVLFTNVDSVERIIYAIFSRFNEHWQNHTLRLFTQAA